MINNSSPSILRRLGRRGMMLSMMGGTYVLIGVGGFIRPDPEVSFALHTLLPPTLRGTLWILTGAMAVVFALRQVPPPKLGALPPDESSWWVGDGPGWTALYVMPFIRIASYTISWAAWLITNHHIGTGTAWYISMIHVPFVLVVLICSGWRENRQMPINEGL